MKIDIVIPETVSTMYSLMGCGIRRSLQELGFESDLIFYNAQELDCDYAIFYAAQMCKGDVETDFANSVIGGEVRKGKGIKVKTIMWQTENLPIAIDKTSLISERKYREFKNYQIYFNYLWAEKREDKTFLESEDYKVDALVFPGYFPELVCAPLDNRGYDTVFFGTINKRRDDILANIPNWTNIKAYGERLSPYLARTKIVINLHYDNLQHLEIERIVHSLAHGCLVISEPIHYSEPFIPGKHFVVGKTEDLPELVKYYLENKEERTKIANAGMEFVRNKVKLIDQIHNGLRKSGII